jgi:hypothetical protein
MQVQFTIRLLNLSYYNIFKSLLRYLDVVITIRGAPSRPALA